MYFLKFVMKQFARLSIIIVIGVGFVELVEHYSNIVFILWLGLILFFVSTLPWEE
jgi:hypothetical protein